MSANKEIIKFFATWCGPCKQLSPTIAQLRINYPEIRVSSVDVDEDEEMAQRFNVRSLPTVVFLCDGRVVNKIQGASTTAVLSAAAELHAL